MKVNEYICFFSSDARYLYYADVFAVMALPYDSTIQFRYRPKYIDPKLGDNIASFKRKDAVIFFVENNNLSIEEKERTKIINSISLRKAKIRDAYYDDDTDLIVFQLQLKEFFSASIESKFKDVIPPNYFVSKIELNGKTSVWRDRVEAIKDTDVFKDSLFFNITAILDRKNKKIQPTYDNNSLKSIFMLHDSEQYTLEILLMDTTSDDKSETKIDNIFSVSEDTKSVFIDIPKTITAGALVDNRKYLAITSSLEVDNISTFINFQSYKTDSKNGNPGFNVILPLIIKRKNIKPILYGVTTSILTACLFTAQILARETSIALCCKIVVVVLLALFSGISVGLLYKFLNKK